MSKTRVTKDKACSKSMYQQQKYMKTAEPLFGWTSNRQALDIPKDNSDPTTSTGTSIIYFLSGEWG